MARHHLSLDEAGPTVRSVMYSGPRTIAAGDPVAAAAEALEHPRTAVVLVCDGDRFLGTIVSADLEGEVPAGATAGDVARAEARTWLAPEDSVERAMELRAELGTARIPVVDEAGALAGLVCFTRKGDSFCVVAPTA